MVYYITNTDINVIRPDAAVSAQQVASVTLMRVDGDHFSRTGKGIPLCPADLWLLSNTSDLMISLEIDNRGGKAKQQYYRMSQKVK